jgi:hypothetical protein
MGRKGRQRNGHDVRNFLFAGFSAICGSASGAPSSNLKVAVRERFE